MKHRLISQIKQALSNKRSLQQLIFRMMATVLLATLQFAAVHDLCAQEPIEIGDTIQFEYRGKTYTAEVFEYFNGSWLRVMLNLNGRKVPHTVNPRHAKLVQRKKSPESEPSEPSRTWKDNSGKFSIEAKLQQLNESEVTLKKSDDTTIVVPLEKLSEEDRAYVIDYRSRRQAMESRPVEASASPENAGSSSSSEQPKPTANQTKPTEDSPDAGSSQAPPTTPPAAIPTWTFQPNSEFPELSYWKQPISIRALDAGSIPGKDSVAISPDGRLLVIRVNGNSKVDYLVIIDAINGQVLVEQAIDNTWPYGDLAISSSGKLILNTNFSKEIEAFRFADGRLTIDETLSKSLSSLKLDFDEIFMMLDDTRLLCSGFQESFIVDFTDPSMPRRSRVAHRSTNPYAVSPDRRYLISNDFFEGLRAIDLKSAKSISTMKIPERSRVSEMAISPDNTRLAYQRDKGTIGIFDLSNLSELSNFRIAPGVFSMRWLAPNLLLINQKAIYETTRGICLWKSSSDGTELVTFGPHSWKLENNQMVLEQHPIVARSKQIADSLSDANYEDLLLLKPNSKINLELKFEFNNPRAAREIESWVIDELGGSGIQLDNSANTKLQISIYPGDEIQAVVTDVSTGGVIQEPRLRPVLYQMKVFRESKLVWQDFRRTTEKFIPKYPQENWYDAVNRHTEPNLLMFQNLEFPSHVLLLPDAFDR